MSRLEILRETILFYFLFFICSVNNSLVEEEKVNRNGSEFKEMVQPKS